MNWRVGLHWAERSCLVMFVAFVLGVSPNFALADSPSERLVLDDRLQQVELWPYVRTLHDPEGLLSPAQAVAELHRFTVPVSAYATLGLRQKVMWLHVPLRTTAGTDGDWVFDQDYTLINRMDLMSVRFGMRKPEFGVSYTVGRGIPSPIAPQSPVLSTAAPDRSWW